MDLYAATKTRISCRAYADKPVEAEKLAVLADRIAEINAAEGLNFKLIGPDAETGVAVAMSEAMFAGPVRWCISCLGADDPLVRERQGYWGEELVLMATALGLGTCWVASTYDKSTVHDEPAADEVRVCIIPVGYAPEKMPLKQATIRKGIRLKTRKAAELMLDGAAEAPQWFRDVVAEIPLSPTAVNRLPVAFAWRDGAAVAEMPERAFDVQDVDLGICKYHFMLVAAAAGVKGAWEWGQGARFVVAE